MIWKTVNISLKLSIFNDIAVKCLRVGLNRSGTPGASYTLHSLKTGNSEQYEKSVGLLKFLFNPDH